MGLDVEPNLGGRQVTIQTIDLRSDLNSLLSRSAQRENKSVAELINEAIEFYLEARWNDALAREAAAYAQLHHSLWQSIPGQWVAVYEGRVVDQDDAEQQLYFRVRERFGEVPILIRQVKAAAEEKEIRLRTPSTGRLQA